MIYKKHEFIHDLLVSKCSLDFFARVKSPCEPLSPGSGRRKGLHTDLHKGAVARFKANHLILCTNIYLTNDSRID